MDRASEVCSAEDFISKMASQAATTGRPYLVRFVSAGEQKQVFDFEPAFRDTNTYRARFFPAAATIYGFRVFGELNRTPVSLTLL